jgi:hypothetical protein
MTNGVIVVVVVVALVVTAVVEIVVVETICVVVTEVMTSFTIPNEAHEANNNPAASIDARQIIFFNFHPVLNLAR